MDMRQLYTDVLFYRHYFSSRLLVRLNDLPPPLSAATLQIISSSISRLASPVLSGVYSLAFASLAPAATITGLSVKPTGRYRPQMWMGWVLTVAALGLMSTIRATDPLLGTWRSSAGVLGTSRASVEAYAQL